MYLFVSREWEEKCEWNFVKHTDVQHRLLDTRVGVDDAKVIFNDKIHF